MLGVKITKQVQITLTPEQWQLYSSLPLVWCVANALNVLITRAFNLGSTREEIERQALQLMNVNKEYGAMDTEPQEVLQDVLSALFAEVA